MTLEETPSLPIRAGKYFGLSQDVFAGSMETVNRDSEVREIIINPPKPLHEIKNPGWGDIRREVIASVEKASVSTGIDYHDSSKWKALSWGGETDPIDVLGAMSKFERKDGVADYYPIKETNGLISRLDERLETDGKALTIPEIFSESLEYLSEEYPDTANPLSAALLAHSATRKKARNQDVNNLTTASKMIDWAQNGVAFFDEKQIKAEPNAAGNTYHFFGALVAGMVKNVFEGERVLSPELNVVGARVAEYVAKAKDKLAGISNPHDHEQVDYWGMRIGRQVSGRFVRLPQLLEKEKSN